MKIEDFHVYTAETAVLLAEAQREGIRMAQLAYLKGKYNLPFPDAIDLPKRIVEDSTVFHSVAIAFAIRKADLDSGKEKVPPDFERAFLSANRRALVFSVRKATLSPAYCVSG